MDNKEESKKGPQLMVIFNIVFSLSIFACHLFSVEDFRYLFTLYTIGILSFVVIITLLFPMYTDCVHYGKCKSEFNAAGLTVVASMFALKFGSALGISTSGYILDLLKMQCKLTKN